MRQLPEPGQDEVAVQPAQCGHAHSAGASGGQAGLGVLHDEAPCGVDAQQRGGAQEAFGVRLAGGDVLDRDQQRRRDAGGVEARLGQLDVGTGDHRPRQVQPVQDGDEVVASREGGHVRQVGVLQLQLAGRRRCDRRVVGLWQEVAHRAVGGAAVRDSEHAVEVDAVLFGPRRPGALHRRVGIHQGAVHVEQYGGHGAEIHEASSIR